MASALLVTSCIDIEAGSPCQAHCREGNWRLRESLVLGGGSEVPDAFDVVVPTGVERGRLALAAATSLTIGARAVVREAEPDQFATVAGLDSVTIGAGARVGSIYSGSANAIVLSKDARVNGFIKAGGEVSNPFGATVTEGILEGRRDRGSSYRFEVSFPELDGTLPGAGDASPRPLAPGAYSRVGVDAASVLVLSAGHYFFGALELSRGGSLLLDQSGGRIYLWVRDSLRIEGAMLPESPLNRVLVGYAGTQTVELGSGFRGLLVAPRARIELRNSGVVWGAVFARSIDVEPGTVIEHIGFDPFDTKADLANAGRPYTG